MKISYIVNVDLDDKAARIIQISSNAKLFYKKFGNDFQLITASKSKYNFNKAVWVNNIKAESSKLRKFLFHIGSLKYILNSDIVYSRNLSILWIANIFNKKIYWEMHDGLISTNNIKIFKKIFKNLNIITTSNAQLNQVKKDFPFYKKDILIARNGVFLEKYEILRNIDKNILREELNLPMNKIIVMHTGSLYKGRGAELFEIIIKNYPDLYFVQVGGTIENINEWKDYYKNYENIKFVGHQDNDVLVKYQMSADLLFYPITKNTATWWCCSPMKIFEYMATGIPILGSNIGSVGEVLTTNNSIVFNPEDEKTILDGINYFLNNRDSCKKLANNALKDIENKYEWNLRVEKIVEFIK
jgi:glycosyltransferase involved in cell wall biosynthesis